MIAYHGKSTEKSAILKQLRAHAKADEIIKGQYWEKGRGCAVGCTLHGSNHADYEPKFGIPQVLARLEDQIFEGLPNGDAKKWPIAFMSAIKPGADLSDIWPKFAIWLLADPKKGVIRFAKTDAQRAAIDGVAELYRKRIPRGDRRWSLARKTAADAAAYAYAAAYAAAHADADAAAYAYAAAYAAAAAAAYAGAAAAYAAADAAAARKIHWRACAAKLLELLRAASIPRRGAARA
jgi:hypothetical protein